MEISGVFSLMLGRPWLHAAGAVPSSLHQKLKFIVENRLVTVDGEDDYNIYKETAVPFISSNDNKSLSYHSFELVSVIRDWGEPRPGKADFMVGKVMLGNNFLPGHGLGSKEPWLPSPPQPKQNEGSSVWVFVLPQKTA